MRQHRLAQREPGIAGTCAASTDEDAHHCKCATRFPDIGRHMARASRLERAARATKCP